MILAVVYQSRPWDLVFESLCEVQNNFHQWIPHFQKQRIFFFHRALYIELLLQPEISRFSENHYSMNLTHQCNWSQLRKRPHVIAGSAITVLSTDCTQDIWKKIIIWRKKIVFEEKCFRLMKKKNAVLWR